MPTRCIVRSLGVRPVQSARGSWSHPQVQEELAVTGIAGDRRFSHCCAVQSYLSSRARGLVDDALMNNRIANDTFLADLEAASLELRLHQGDNVAAAAEHRRYAREHVTQRDERHVDGDDVDRTVELGRLQVACVRALDDHDPWIASQPPIELAVTDIEGDDANRAPFEEHIGETAGRRADVESLATVDRDAKRIECMCQLDPPAADIGMIGLPEGDFRIFRDRGAGFLYRAAR